MRKRLVAGVTAVLIGAAGTVAGAAGGATWLVSDHNSGSKVSGTSDQVATGTSNDVAGAGGTVTRSQNRSQKSSGVGDQKGVSAGGPVNGPGGTQVAGGVGAGPRDDGGVQYAGAGAGTTTRDSRTSTDSRRSSDSSAHGGQGTQNFGGTQTVITNPKQDPPGPGVVSLDAVAPGDGGRTMSTISVFTLTVKKLPTNGNTLFMVCRLQNDDPSNPDLYFARAELTDTGQQTLTLRWGGAYSSDPTLVGSSRSCGVVSADPGATLELSRLMYVDSKGIELDPDGTPYDIQRTSLPVGTTWISRALQVTIARLESTTPTPSASSPPA